MQGLVDSGSATTADLRTLEDESIRDVVAQHESIGFPVVTDGEFRRRNFQDSFGGAVSGYDTPDGREEYERWQAGNRSDRQQRVESGPQVAGPPVVTRRPTRTRLELARNLPLEEYRFVAGIAKAPSKVTLIGPDRVAQRFDWQASLAVYDGLDDFTDHVASIQHEMVEQLVDAGCRYVHIDAPGYTAYVDGPSIRSMRARGEDPDENLERSISADNKVIDSLPGATFGIHLCRGNSRATDPNTGEMVPQWHREGHYDAIAERLFTGLHHDRLLLEYDSERSGGFEPLRFVPKDKIVVLGLVTTKSTVIETVDYLKRRIDQASRYIPVDQLALSPQCGFASGANNSLPEDVQWRKLEAILETAVQVWG
jgi:5-methyltetrahydropteroyltriglutamate--homocysteine methyltransferase